MNKIISCCGAVCSDCKSYPDNCGGCESIHGKAEWINYVGIDVCPIFKCCRTEKEFYSCSKCNDLPCGNYYLYKDPRITDEEYNQTIAKAVALLKDNIDK